MENLANLSSNSQDLGFSKLLALELIAGFTKISEYKDTNVDNTANNKKGNLLEKCFHKLLEHIFNDAEYTIKANYPLINKYGAKINADLVIFKQNNPIVLVESKDYIDIDMYKRYILDILLLKTTYPDLNYLLLAMRKAYNDQNREAIVNTFDLADIAQQYTVLNTGRSSKALYVLDLPEDQVVEVIYNTIMTLRQLFIVNRKESIIENTNR